MKAKPIIDFALQFNVKISLADDLVDLRNGRYFLLDERLKKAAGSDYFYAGTYLGKVKGGRFFPSFILLSMLAEAGGNRVSVNRKAGWLFICGRDVLGNGIVRCYGSVKLNRNVLVLNEFGECLGFGRVVGSLDNGEGRVVVGNVLDVGDFLRRERHNF